MPAPLELLSAELINQILDLFDPDDFRDWTSLSALRATSKHLVGLTNPLLFKSISIWIHPESLDKALKIAQSETLYVSPLWVSLKLTAHQTASRLHDQAQPFGDFHN